jgi:hypothetical protein
MKSFESKIQFGDDRSVEVKGIGEVVFYSIVGQKKIKVTISDVLFVPEMKINLISVGRLTKKSYKIVFEKNKCKIYLIIS